MTLKFIFPWEIEYMCNAEESFPGVERLLFHFQFLKNLNMTKSLTNWIF